MASTRFVDTAVRQKNKSAAVANYLTESKQIAIVNVTELYERAEGLGEVGAVQSLTFTQILTSASVLWVSRRPIL